MTQDLKSFYTQVIIPNLVEQFKLKNKHEVPRIEKIVINRGLGDAAQKPKLIEKSLNELSLITGQRGVVTRAKKAISGFKLRKGMPIGVCVTLRDEKMYGFLDRFIHLALPRIRDFQGVSLKSFDGNGNYSIGLKEQLMFPEIEYDKIDDIRGMDVSFITNSKDEDKVLALLKEFKMPFQRI